MRLTTACACEVGDFTIDCCRLRTSGGVRGADIVAMRQRPERRGGRSLCRVNPDRDRRVLPRMQIYHTPTQENSFFKKRTPTMFTQLHPFNVRPAPSRECAARVHP